MKLYYSPGACSLSPHIVLREAGYAFELEKVNLRSKETASGIDYRTINPKGYVPALQLDNGEILTEGPAIVQYLADMRPETALMPAVGTMPRYRAAEWLNFISTELHKNFSPLFDPSTAAETRAAAIERLKLRLEYAAGQIEGREFLLGTQFTVPDAYLFTVLGWADHVKIDLSHWSSLSAYRGRIFARPTVQAAMKAEGLLK